ncbi:MAG TPA: glucuronate isomerase, partial [Blastococcus sp.]
FYPSVYVGVPWWFLDAPDAQRRFREAVFETAGFSRTSGFVDDTRAFCSIPARHDLSRRVDAGVLGRLVAEHRLTEEEAVDTAVDLVSGQPTRVFKL